MGAVVGRDPWAPIGAVGWRARLDGAEDPAVGVVVAALEAAALALAEAAASLVGEANGADAETRAVGVGLAAAAVGLASDGSTDGSADERASTTATPTPSTAEIASAANTGAFEVEAPAGGTTTGPCDCCSDEGVVPSADAAPIPIIPEGDVAVDALGPTAGKPVAGSPMPVRDASHDETA
jgi:hypothetical protein